MTETVATITPEQQDQINKLTQAHAAKFAAKLAKKAAAGENIVKERAPSQRVPEEVSEANRAAYITLRTRLKDVQEKRRQLALELDTIKEQMEALKA